MKNEILEELWRVKDEIAKEYEYDIDKLSIAIREKEKIEKANIIDLSLLNDKFVSKV